MNPTGAQIAAIRDTRTTTAQTTGCPEWETPGIRAALQATHGNPADVMAAAHLAAGDPKLRFPTEAGFVQHWPRNAARGPDRSHNVPCPDHPEHDMPCPRPADPIEPPVLASLAAQCRAQIKHPATKRWPTQTVTSDVEAARRHIDQQEAKP